MSILDLKGLAEKATPRPWKFDTDNIFCVGRMDNLIANAPEQKYPSYLNWVPNAALIVAAVNALPAIDTMVAKLVELEEELRKQSGAYFERYSESPEPADRRDFGCADTYEICADALRAILRESGVEE